MEKSKSNQAPPAFAPPKASGGTYRAPFPNESSMWEVYINEAITIDAELVKDWTSSLNFLLVFAAIFSAVLTAFVVESKNMLQQDSTDALLNAFLFYLNNTANGTHTQYIPPPFVLPPNAVPINCLFFASLSASIMAALASVVALQWVSDYDTAVSRAGASPEDRMSRRHYRYMGVEVWKMHGIIASLPILLYISLVLFFAGLTQWMWSIDTSVGAIVLGCMLAGVLFYIVTTVLAVLFPSCPFRTPLSTWIYTIGYYTFHRFPVWITEMTTSNRSLKEVSEGYTKTLGQMSWLLSQLVSGHTYRKFGEGILQIYSKPTPQKRDDSRIERNKDKLVASALSWLAQNISISSDSRQRLLYLAAGFVELAPKRQESDTFKDLPWGKITRFLMEDINLRAPKEPLSDSDVRCLEVIMGCLNNPILEPLIVAENRQFTGAENYSLATDPTYRLLRNMQISARGRQLSFEEQVKLRVFYWNKSYDLIANSQARSNLQEEFLQSPANAREWFIRHLMEWMKKNPSSVEEDGIFDIISPLYLELPIMPDFPLHVRCGGRTIVIKNPSLDVYRLLCQYWLRNIGKTPTIHSFLEFAKDMAENNEGLRSMLSYTSDADTIQRTADLADQGDRQIFYRELDDAWTRNAFSDSLVELDAILCRDYRKNTEYNAVFIYTEESRDYDTTEFDFATITDAQRDALSTIRSPALRLLASSTYGVDWFDDSASSSRPRNEQAWRVASQYAVDQLDVFSDSIWDLRWRVWELLDGEATLSFVRRMLGDKEELDKAVQGFDSLSAIEGRGTDFVIFITYSAIASSDSDPGRLILQLLCDGSRSLSVSSDDSKEQKAHPAAEFEGVDPKVVKWFRNACKSIKDSPERLFPLLVKLFKAYLHLDLTNRNPDDLKYFGQMFKRSLPKGEDAFSDVGWSVMGKLAADMEKACDELPTDMGIRDKKTVSLVCADMVRSICNTLCGLPLWLFGEIETEELEWESESEGEGDGEGDGDGEDEDIELSPASSDL